MPLTTVHQFLDAYPIKPDSKYLIIGTIHPHGTDDFKTDFFYGNKNSLWSILSEAFPNKDFSNKKKIIERLNESKTSITDMIRKCDRADATVTQDKELFNITLNTDQIRKGIAHSTISTLFLTSRFGKNNAARLFVDSFKIRYKDSWDEERSSFKISKEVFGREITAMVLFSPSGQANIGISGSAAYQAKKHFYSNKKTPVKEFKIHFYQEKFAYLNE